MKDTEVAAVFRSQVELMRDAQTLSDWKRARAGIVALGEQASALLVAQLGSRERVLNYGSMGYSAEECLVGLGEAAVPELTRLVASGDRADLRRTAAELLARIGVRRRDVVERLREGTRDPSFEVRSACASALLRLDADEPTAVEALRSGLRSGETEEETLAFQDACRAGPAAAPLLPDVFSTLERRGELQQYRDANLTLLGPEAIAHMLAALRSTNAKFVALVTSSLSRIARSSLPSPGGGRSSLPATALPPLIANLTHPDRDVRIGSMNVLGSMGPAAAPAVPALFSRVSREDSSLSEFAASSIVEIGAVDPGDASVVVAALDDPSDRIQAVALRLLPVHPADTARMATRVLQAADHSDARVRCAALLALGRIEAGPEASLAVLKAALHADAPEVREAAARTLAAHPSLGRLAVDDLKALTKAPLPETRALALAVLARIQPEVVSRGAELVRMACQQPGEAPRGSELPGHESGGPGFKAETEAWERRAHEQSAALKELAALGPIARPWRDSIYRLAVDPSAPANERAFRAIVAIEGPTERVMDALMRTLRRDTPPPWIYDVLGAIGPPARAALPRLEELLEEARWEDVLKDAQHKFGSEQAVRRIRGS